MPAQFAQGFDCQVAKRDGMLHVQVMKGNSGKTINRDYGYVFDLPMNEFTEAVLPVTHNAEESCASEKKDYHRGEITFTTWDIAIQLFAKSGNVFLIWEKDQEDVDLPAIVAGLCEMFYL